MDLRVEGNKAIVRIKIAHPKKSYATLIPISGIGTIGVEERLYWVRPKEGCIYECYVEWVTALPS
jgi:hypothetical protein